MSIFFFAVTPAEYDNVKISFYMFGDFTINLYPANTESDDALQVTLQNAM